MSQIMSIEKAAAGLADLVHSLSAGDEIIPTENNLVVARILPNVKASHSRVPGMFKVCPATGGRSIALLGIC